MKKLLCFLFTVRVLIPTQTRMYYDVIDFVVHDSVYVLQLSTHKKVMVPVMFTIIEEN